ncbi:unnamed protein product [Darwinula stevensoni]|uniref:BZIP domain-containing protein n=1 Tax=Darwinula stevensoni TaxID=69355 RepID=A0A7R9AFF7_9CRUS|nr:unnamed protein product [Darwinula stevensoni]CAG0902997.1 unnamed protein product [Darwinula stevensoni]
MRRRSDPRGQALRPNLLVVDRRGRGSIRSSQMTLASSGMIGFLCVSKIHEAVGHADACIRPPAKEYAFPLRSGTSSILFGSVVTGPLSSLGSLPSLLIFRQRDFLSSLGAFSCRTPVSVEETEGSIQPKLECPTDDPRTREFLPSLFGISSLLESASGHFPPAFPSPQDFFTPVAGLDLSEGDVSKLRGAANVSCQERERPRKPRSHRNRMVSRDRMNEGISGLGNLETQESLALRQRYQNSLSRNRVYARQKRMELRMNNPELYEEQKRKTRETVRQRRMELRRDPQLYEDYKKRQRERMKERRDFLRVTNPSAYEAYKKKQRERVKAKRHALMEDPVQAALIRERNRVQARERRMRKKMGFVISSSDALRSTSNSSAGSSDSSMSSSPSCAESWRKGNVMNGTQRVPSAEQLMASKSPAKPSFPHVGLQPVPIALWPSSPNLGQAVSVGTSLMHARAQQQRQLTGSGIGTNINGLEVTVGPPRMSTFPPSSAPQPPPSSSSNKQALNLTELKALNCSHNGNGNHAKMCSSVHCEECGHGEGAYMTAEWRMDCDTPREISSSV